VFLKISVPYKIDFFDMALEKIIQDAGNNIRGTIFQRFYDADDHEIKACN
jgi:hypothetical protein